MGKAMEPAWRTFYNTTTRNVIGEKGTKLITSVNKICALAKTAYPKPVIAAWNRSFTGPYNKQFCDMQNK